MVLIVAGCGATPVPPTTTPTAQPTTTSTAAPTAAPSPSPSPTATAVAPTVSPEPVATECCDPSTAPPTPGTSGVLSLDESRIGEHLDALQQIADDNNGSRAVGTSGYDASADYVEQQLTDMGYTVARSEVPYTSFIQLSPTTVAVGNQTWTSPEWVQAMIYSAPGDLTEAPQAVGIQNGQPTANGACDFGAWSEFHPGNIAIVMGGPCIRRDLVTLAVASGASAVISLVPQWGANMVLQPTLVDPSGISIPVIGAGSEPSAALLAALNDGTQVSVHVDVEREPATVDSVIAELPGVNDTAVMLGGHLDSVLAGPGINDNGSGVSTLLAIAESVADGPAPTSTVRFAFWAAEEFGDIGSVQYVQALSQAEREQIRAYLNLDMVASPNAGLFVYRDQVIGQESADLGEMLVQALTDRGYPSLWTDTGGASDHFAFEDAGIPESGVFSGISPLSSEEAQLFGGVAGQPADPCYHLSCDTRTNTDTGTAMILGTAVADLVSKLAY